MYERVGWWKEYNTLKKKKIDLFEILLIHHCHLIEARCGGGQCY